MWKSGDNKYIPTFLRDCPSLLLIVSENESANQNCLRECGKGILRSEGVRDKVGINTSSPIWLPISHFFQACICPFWLLWVLFHYIILIFDRYSLTTSYGLQLLIDISMSLFPMWWMGQLHYRVRFI